MMGTGRQRKLTALALASVLGTIGDAHLIGHHLPAIMTILSAVACELRGLDAEG